MTRLSSFAFLCLLGATAHADALILNPDSMHPELELVVLPDAASLERARVAGYWIDSTPWGGQLARVPQRAAGLEPSPFASLDRIDFVDPAELYGISGIPVMMEGDARVGIMPYRDGLTALAPAASTRAEGRISRTAAWPEVTGWLPNASTMWPNHNGWTSDPASWPDINGWLPELIAYPSFNGWRVTDDAGTSRGFAGLAPASWMIGGVLVSGMGVLVDELGEPVALLGVPVLQQGTSATSAAGVHLVHL